MPIKQVPGAIWAAMRHNVSPGEYYAYALWKPDRKVNIDNYLYAREASRLFKLLNRPSQPNPIDDKLAFYQICKAHSLPTPEILAAFTPTGKLLEFELDLPPKRDLFVKPRIGCGGDGTEHFRWGGVAFESERCGRLRPEDLGGYLATRARTENRTLLVQPALETIASFIFCDANLATARLVTGLSTDGDVSLSSVISIFFWGTADQSVALIDLASGRVNVGEAKIRWHEVVTATRVRMTAARCRTGEQCCDTPKWRIKHAANFVFIGWDVAFTEQGPMLLEGNVNWEASDYQRLRGEPLGHTKFAAVLATRLRDLVSG